MRRRFLVPATEVRTERLRDHAGEGDAEAVLRASRALLGVVARSLAPALEEVTLPQFRALVILSGRESGLSQRELADELGVHPSTFSRTTDRLVSGGWVHRAENPNNRRETFIELTGDGRRLVALVTRRRRDEVARILRRLDGRERRQVVDGLTVFADAAGELGVDLSALGVATTESPMNEGRSR